MERFKACLRNQLCDHRSMLPRDVVKLCYQAACGAEHLLSDLTGARAYFEEEYQSISPRNEPLIEQISAEVCRINMGAWKQTGMPSQWLFRMFANTVFQTDGKKRLRGYLLAAEEVLCDVGYDMDAWYAYMNAYEAEGMPAVRHSEQYRAQEQPAYRIVSTAYLRLIPVLQEIWEKKSGGSTFVIDIDGKQGEGKRIPEEQLRRITARNGEELAEMFRTRWIPMENHHFEAYKIRERAELVIQS